jgi:hypothetical protein
VTSIKKSSLAEKKNFVSQAVLGSTSVLSKDVKNAFEGLINGIFTFAKVVRALQKSFFSI